MKFNTAIATLMALVNDFNQKTPSRGDIRTLLPRLAPFAPHVAEELGEIQGFGGMACRAAWPAYDAGKTIEAEREIAVQVGGKLKATVTVPTDADDETVLQAAMANEKIQKLVEGKDVIRTIVVKNKLVNLIVK
jgi:leucyl-tRNA synthetase